MAKPRGWRKEPARHSLAAKGVKTKQRNPNRGVPYFDLNPSEQPTFGEVFVDAEGNIFKYVGVQHHPISGEIVDLFFEDQDGQQMGVPPEHMGDIGLRSVSDEQGPFRIVFAPDGEHWIDAKKNTRKDVVGAISEVVEFVDLVPCGKAKVLNYETGKVVFEKEGRNYDK